MKRPGYLMAGRGCDPRNVGWARAFHGFHKVPPLRRGQREPSGRELAPHEDGAGVSLPAFM